MTLSAQQSDSLRVLVVEDSATQRQMLVSLLESDAELNVVGSVAGGRAAIRAATTLQPDVITMDLRLPDIDGLAATQQIMQEAPTPIVVVTAHASPDDGQVVFDALQAGALALVQKPYPGPGDDVRRNDLLRTVKSMARVRVVRRRPRLAPMSPASAIEPSAVVPAVKPKIVAIGASTGGPQALRELLTALPAAFPLPILLVQHMAPGFLPTMVQWLQPQCALPIRLAASGLRLLTAGIYIAPTGQQMIVRQGTIELLQAPPVGGHCPSATVLFQSIAREYGAAAVGALLTGMGDDGAAGMRDLKRYGATTIVQDEASSVVFGMPKAAIELGVVDHILSPGSIASTLVELAEQKRNA